jgi:serine/threonine protein kinase
MAGDKQLTSEVKSMRFKISSEAHEILRVEKNKLTGIFRDCIREHRRALTSGGGCVRKNSPESAVTIISLRDFPPLCVKEFKPRGFMHGVKKLFRSSKASRTFENGLLLQDHGVTAAKPLALVGTSGSGFTKSEWVIMEVIHGSMELDRYILKKSSRGWTDSEKRNLVRELAEFLGSMHSRGIYHSDMKTCNILASEDHISGRNRFYLVDYDDVIFGKSFRKKAALKNLSQIFLSTPSIISIRDRMRFLRIYSRYAGLNPYDQKMIRNELTELVRDREMLYVGFDGDIRESL